LVRAGQSFWSIAIAYQITIRDLEVWNNLSSDNDLLVGKELFIPSSGTEGYATPTPVGMVLLATPDAGGVIVHEVQPYQALFTIAEAYKTKVETILALNVLQADWPLQIGQNLLIDAGFVTPSATPRPLTALERLTPSSDGKYYHEVSSGEFLAWIADLYEINLADLMAWNGLTSDAILLPGQQLLLRVTPPATVTPIPVTPSATSTSTLTPVPPTSTQVLATRPPSPSAAVETEAQAPLPGMGVLVVVVLVVGGLVLLGWAWRRR
jgi:LysM repeat protein